MVPVQFFFPQRFFRFSTVYYCDLSVTNPVMVILQIIFVKTFLVTGLVWRFALFPKITMCTFECLLLKVIVFFVLLLNWKGGLFSPHGWHLPGRTALTKYDFTSLLSLKPIIGTLGNTFLWSSSQPRIICNSFNYFFKCLNTE